VTETTKFVILGTQRTGTTLIRTSLDSHPDILCCGEVFNLGRRPYRNDDGFWKYSNRSIYHRLRSGLFPRTVTKEYLEQLFLDQPYYAVGFKFMLSHCKSRPYILRLLTQYELKAVLVIRRNALKTLISRRTAAASGVYHISDTLKAKSAVRSWNARQIYLDSTSLLSELQSIVSERDQWRSLVGKSFELFELVYEDYVKDHDSMNRKLQTFLNVNEYPLESDLKKVNPDKLEQILGNFGEVRQILEGTKFEEFLNT